MTLHAATWTLNPPDPELLARVVMARCRDAATCSRCAGTGWHWDIETGRAAPTLCDDCGGSGLDLELGGEA